VAANDQNIRPVPWLSDLATVTPITRAKGNPRKRQAR